MRVVLFIFQNDCPKLTLSEQYIGLGKVTLT